MSTIPRRLVVRSLTILVTRASTWLNRSPYIVPGEMSATVAVLPEASGRPSDGCTSAFGAAQLAVISGPGALWNVPLSCTSHGSGYDTANFASIWKGGVTRQNRKSGDAGRLTGSVVASVLDARTAQSSVFTRPVFTPPCTRTPRGSFAFSVKSKPS